jgi:hypothetical protein
VTKSSQTAVTGPHAWINWYAERAGYPRREEAHPDAVVIRPIWEEFALSTDCDLSGPWITAGPYEFITLDQTAAARVGHARRAVILRAWDHIPDHAPSHDTEIHESTEQFVGGDLGDELAALLGLALNRRIRSGGPVRQGLPGSDQPLGFPTETTYHEPTLDPPRHAAILPGVASPASLADAQELLATYPALPPADAVVLVRAARQYVDGLWLADADPRIAWIKFVGALEAAAARRDDSRQDTPIEQLKRHKKGLYRRLEKGPPEALAAVADQFARTFFVERKVRSFVKQFGPGPPTIRPSGAGWHFPWNELDDALHIIYDHRSRDLHDGIPFPPPLCEPPHIADDGIAAERFPALAIGTLGGKWSARQLPMYLHVFAHVVGGSLRNWWSSLAAAAEEAGVASNSP